MSPDSPPSPEGYLHKVLVNGVTQFHYRSGVRSLLGMPEATADSPIAASLPPIEFLYATPAIAAIDESDAGEEDKGKGRHADTETSAMLNFPPIQQSASNELELSTQQPTQFTQEAQHLAPQRSEPVQRSPISSAAELVSSEMTEAITPSGNCEAIVPPTKPEAFSEDTPSQPIPIAIPGITEQRFSPIDPLQIVPELLQPDRANEVQPSETNSQPPSSLNLPLNQPELWAEHPSSPSTLYSESSRDKAAGTELPTQQISSQPLALSAQHSALNGPELPSQQTHSPTLKAQHPASQTLNSGQQTPVSSEVELFPPKTNESIAPKPPLVAAENLISEVNSDSQSLLTTPTGSELCASNRDPLPVKLVSSHPTTANVAPQIYPVIDPSIKDTLLPERAANRADDPDQVSDSVTATARSRQHSNSTPNRLKLNPTSSVEQPQIASPDVNGAPVSPAAVSAHPQASTGATLSAPIPPASVSIAEDVLTPLSRGNLQPRPAIASPTTPKLAEEIIKLRRMIADLEAQVTAQKNSQQPPSPRFAPPPVQPVKVVERSPQTTQALTDQTTKAYWERSYMSRLYRWSRR